jgi:putative ABC transport system permease protein
MTRRLFRFPMSRARARRDVDAELRFHIEGRIEELIASGRTRAEAERAAHEAFGNVEHYRRETSAIDRRMAGERRRIDHRDAIRREARLAVRSLARTRAFSIVAIATLALGIGATSAIFTLVDTVALRPLGYPQPEELIAVRHPVEGPGVSGEWGVSSAGYYHFVNNARTIHSLAAYYTMRVNIVGSDAAERVQLALSTANTFGTLGIRPAVGRLFDAGDDRPGGPPVAVLGYDLWVRRFGGDSSVVGRTIEIEGGRVPVIGVAARGATLPSASAFSPDGGRQSFRADLWMPLRLDPGARPSNSHPFNAIGRLAPGHTVADAERELIRLTSRFTELFPTAYEPSFIREYRFRVAVHSVRDEVVGSAARLLWLMLGAVGLVLLIACANVANLFVVRTETQRRETAIRSALGAERAHLAWHFIAESVMLTMCAAVIGVALAQVGVRLLAGVAPDSLPRLDEAHVRWTTLVLAALLAVISGIGFGLLPLARRSPQSAALKEAGRGGTLSRRQQIVRGGLVVAQIALALVLLAASGLLVKSLSRLQRVRPGFDAERVVAIEVALPEARYNRYEPVAAYMEQATTRIAALPGVEAVGLTSDLPLDGFVGCSLVFSRDVPRPTSSDVAACVATPRATPGFFGALGIRVRGREPTWRDVTERTGGAIVTRALAERLWPGQEPIGKSINSNGGQGSPYYTVVGVIDELRAEGLDRPATEAVFYPVLPFKGQWMWEPPRQSTLVIRTRTVDPTAVTASVRRVLTELDAGTAIGRVRSMDEVLAQSTARVSFIMLLLSIAAGFALLLSAVGTYGVIAYLIGRRSAEIGIRMALGATASRVVGLVVRRSLILAIAGVAIGLVAALATTRLLTALLFEVSPTDPATLAIVAIVLVIIALVASYLPARRAARVSPVDALRSDA